MINPQVLAYVRQQLAGGVSREDIRKAMAEQGWNDQDADEVFAAITPAQSAPPVTAAPVVAPVVSATPVATTMFNVPTMQKAPITPTDSAPSAASIAPITPTVPNMPVTPVAPTAASARPVSDPKHTATIGKRFWGKVIDLIILCILASVANFVIKSFTASLLLQILFGWVMWPAYFVVFETVWQRTPGKWVTKTKVVTLDGTKAGLLRIIARTLCRYIPFDALSYLFGRYPYGWHDRISKTMVVPASYSVADASVVNPKDKGKSIGGIIAFVLVLLTMVAIPAAGIFASVMLASLSSARQKGREAAVSENMRSLLIDSAIYQINNNSYKGFCSSGEAVSVLQKTSQYSTVAPGTYTCNDSVNNWAASVHAPTIGFVCVDASSTQPIPLVLDIGTTTSCTGS